MSLIYIDRHLLGIEMFFAGVSPVTSKFNELTPEETVTHMRSRMSFLKCNKLCKDIQRGIQKILSSSCDVAGVVPAEVAAIGKSLPDISRERVEMLIPFFEWLQKIQRDNEQARVRWLAAINDVADRIGGQLGSFLSSFTMMYYQQSSLVQAKEKVVFTMHEKLWGSAKVIFEDAKLLGDLPVFGFVHWIEADTVEKDEHGRNIYEFRILMDTEFSNTKSNIRILQDHNWQTVVIRASEINFFSVQRNYMKRKSLWGCSAHLCMLRGMEELLQKSYVLGERELTAGEKELLPLARIFDAYDLLGGEVSKKSNTKDSVLIDVLENRFAYMKMLTAVEKECGDTCHEIIDALKGAIEHYDCEDLEVTLKYLEHYRKMIVVWEMTSDGPDFFEKSIVNLMNRATEDLPLSWEIFSGFTIAKEMFAEKVRPVVEGNGFSGEYPHYRRMKGSRAQFLTFACMMPSEVPRDSMVRYCFSIKVAQSRMDTDRKVNSVPFERLNASDFEDSSKQFAHIASQDDAGLVFLDYNLYVKEVAGEEDFPSSILPFLQVAISALDKKPIPSFYKRSYLRTLHRKNSVWKKVLDMLPFSIIITVCGLLCFFGWAETMQQKTVLALSSLVAGMVPALITAALYWYRKRNKLWDF